MAITLNYNGGNGQVIPGSTMQSWIMDQNGNISDGYQGTPNIGAVTQGFQQADAAAAQEAYNKTANWIDPTTGQIKPGFYPQTQADWNALQRHASEMGASKQAALYGQEASLYGYGKNSTNGTFNPNQTGGLMGPGGSVVQGNGTGGAVGGASSSTFTQSPAVDPALYDPWKQALLGVIKSPGLDPRTEQDIVNRGNEGLSVAQSDALRQQQQQAAAQGFQNSGDSMQAQNAINSQYAGQKASNARDTHLQVQQQAQQNRLQATGQIGSYLGQQQQIANQNKMAYAGLLNQQANQQNVPDFSGKGQGVPNMQFAPPGGGGYQNSAGAFGDFLNAMGSMSGNFTIPKPIGGKNASPMFQPVMA